MLTAFGRNFKAIREDRGMTQQQAADALGVTQNTVGGWETRGKLPRQGSLVEYMCVKLDVSETDLFGMSDGYYSRTRGAVPSITADPSSVNVSVVGSGDGETVQVPSDVYAPGDFCVRVSSDCLDKVLPVGCVALVRPGDVSDGNIGLVDYKGKTMLKRLKKHDGVLFLLPDSHNAKHKRRIVDETDPDSPPVQIHGRVVWYGGTV